MEDQALSCSRMIRLLAQLLPPSPVSKLSLSQSSCVSPVELTDERGEGGGGRGANNMNARKPGPLYINIIVSPRADLRNINS
jgi:hypothetical protein